MWKVWTMYGIVTVGKSKCVETLFTLFSLLLNRIYFSFWNFRCDSISCVIPICPFIIRFQTTDLYSLQLKQPSSQKSCYTVSADKLSVQSSCPCSEAVHAVKLSRKLRKSSQSSSHGSQAFKRAVRVRKQSDCQAINKVRLSRRSRCQGSHAVSSQAIIGPKL